MKDFPFMILIIFFGLYLILFTCHYKIEEFRYNSLILSITEAAKVAGFQSLDNSIRAETGTVEVTTENFEMSFEKKLNDTVNVKLKNPKYSYDYLRADDGTIMAIRVVVRDETNTQYQATYIADAVNW
ncbi:hypothetical protein B4102_2207 [Heyndrickxia sporothermodurans]|uniref:Uncharacterized protein n=1 Tax=Heyndrickxia sporothermodurans TaxID=46224 RepID=A0A150LHJ2_9BACI|nr:hypothetical protein [Heyndrickxia sporothermodurans]KYD11479.1 hypothetical protein B4102_2207 [Heyndrickxia sporothermodurans]